MRTEIHHDRCAFPDLGFTIEDQIAEGDKVVTRYGAPKGVVHDPFGVIFSRIDDDGKIAEGWIVARGFELQWRSNRDSEADNVRLLAGSLLSMR